jgi:hypothetical protein
MVNHDALMAAYTAPGRHYHNLTHIEDCLGALAAWTISRRSSAKLSSAPFGGTMWFTTDPVPTPALLRPMTGEPAKTWRGNWVRCADETITVVNGNYALTSS